MKHGIKKRATCLVFSLLWLVTSNVTADEVIKESPQGGINWSQGTIFAHGYGTAAANKTTAQRRLLSHRAAVVDAQRNLLEITKGVRLTSEIKTDQLLQQSRETVAKVEGLIRGARVVKRHYQNNIASVTLAMPMAGDFLKITMPPLRLSQHQPLDSQLNTGFMSDVLNYGSNLTQLVGIEVLNALIPLAQASSENPLILDSQQEAETYKKLLKWIDSTKPADVTLSLSAAVTSYESNSQFSGLLIDASAVPNFELATIPKIRDVEGTIIYPSQDTSYNDIVNKRGVSYDFDIDDAIAHKRVATTPFIIKAVSTYKNLSSDLIISNDDALRINQSPSTKVAMNKAGVLIVVAL